MLACTRLDMLTVSDLLNSIGLHLVTHQWTNTEGINRTAQSQQMQPVSCANARTAGLGLPRLQTRQVSIGA